MNTKIKTYIKITAFILITLYFASLPIYTQSTDEMDRQAQAYFDNKEFSKAVALWLNILDVDPNNMEVQKKVEFLYEMKQRKDLELEKSKMNYKLAKKEIGKNFVKGVTLDDAEDNLNSSKETSKIAFESFIIAYRIDPKDTDMQLIREDMQKLEKIIASEEKRLALSREQRERAKALTLLAVTAMDEARYKDALGHWSEILTFMPENIEAIEGKRQAEIAIDNIIRYESIKRFLASGISYFELNDFKLARQDFMSVLQLDPENGAAQDYIEKIDDILNSKKKYEQRLREAEIFYVSGLKNLRENKFEEARDELENTISLIPNYKDARARLASIPALKAEFDRREKERRLRRINEEFQTGLVALAALRYQDAIAAFENTLKLDPGNKLAPVYIRRAKDAQKLVEEEVVDENSSYYDLVNSLAVSGRRLFEAGKYEESKKRWNQILELFPANRIANEYNFKCELRLNPATGDAIVKKMFTEGEDLLKKKEYTNAYRKFALVKSIYPDYPDIDNFLKRAEREQSYSGTASLTQEDKDDIERRYNLGMSYYQKGGDDNVKKALVELRWVASKDPNNTKAVVAVNKIEAQLRIGSSAAKSGGSKLTPEQEALVRKYYYSGINYYSNNDFKRAIAEWRKVVAIDPNHTRAKNNIRKCLALLGQ
jgi:tetratricopeptide (TPR) repeat protein